MTHSQIFKSANFLELLTHKPKPAPSPAPVDTHPIRQNMDIRKKLINGDDLSQATPVAPTTPLPSTTPLPADNLNFPKMASAQAYHPDIQTPGDAVDNVSELKQISDLLQKHPERLAPAKDVLNDTSMTIPKGVVRGAGGAALGAGVGDLAAHLLDGPEETLEDRKRHESHHRMGASAGAALGLLLASHNDIANSHWLDSVRQKLAI